MAITSNPINQNGALITGQGTKTALNITTKTAVKSTVGRVAKVNVIAAATGSNPGFVYDAASTASATGSATIIAPIPDTIGIYTIDMPVSNGIVIAPGTNGTASQTIAVSYL